LTEYLFTRHNVNAPPDGLLDVHYEMELVHILGIDELKQTMTVLVYVDEKWNDPSLSWDPALFGGITKTWLPIGQIWVPDIIIFNMLHHEDLLSAVRAPVLIYPNGTVEASHPAVYTVTCEINIKRFPLDDQRCRAAPFFQIASWTYGKDKIRLHAHTEHSLEHYTDNEEWRLLKVTVVEDEYEHEGINVSELRYDVSVKRRPLFYMVTLTFPSYVMCAISVVGLFARFSTTGEREERFTLGVTAILTMAVLSLVVSEKVPHSSTHVPLLGELIRGCHLKECALSHFLAILSSHSVSLFCAPS
uniref:Neur_chan_LBD domain-containing protein n=1 Tax=Heligmosomoides polygyrus TaxID=6339 RepID=A0A183G2E3_HELPZ